MVKPDSMDSCVEGDNVELVGHMQVDGGHAT